jgi:glyoxylase-like metal-dependent hydrolase (beta-lactamase superfamily II)
VTLIKTEELEGVVKIKLARSFLGRPLYFTTAYWVDGLLIDTGCAHTQDEFLAIVENLGIDRIVNTHSHEDHIGANGALQARYSVEILAHAEALPTLADPRRLRLQPYRRIFWGYPTPSVAQPVGEVVETPHHRFQVIHTPGHSPDHVCLYEPQKGWLFTGDAYIGGRDRALRADYDIYAIIDSLKKLARLESTRLFPASGTVRDNPRQDLVRKIEYLEETGSRVRELHRKGLTLSQIRKEIFGRELPIAYVTLGHFSGRNLVRSYLENSPRPLGFSKPQGSTKGERR